MRKLALGLNSIPSGNVPGSENVEVPNLNEEDIESANKTGFNAIEQSGFDKEEGLDKAVIAYNKVFNYRLGKKMRDELIKLNKALNGIGYKNLIKIAILEEALVGYADPRGSGSEKEEEDPCILKGELEKQVKNLIWEEVTKLEIIEEDKYSPLYTDIFSSIIYSTDDFTVDSLHNIFKKHVPNVSIKLINRLYGKIGKYAVRYKVAAKNCKPVSTPAAAQTGEFISGEDAGNYLRNLSKPAQTSGASTKPVVAAKHPLNPSIKGMNYYDDNWTYRIIDEKTVEVGRESDGKSFTIKMDSYRNWNNFKRNLEDGIRKGTITSDDDKVSVKTKEPVAPAATSTPPAVAPTTPEAAQPSTGGSVTETVNGKLAVSIGTFGKDQIFLIIESVKKGKPEFYIKDGKTREASLLGPNDGRVRSSLGPLEINRLSKSLADANLTPVQIEGFKRYMNLQRMQNRNPLFRKRRGEDIEDARKKMMTSSSREERLDRLKKKGVI